MSWPPWLAIDMASPRSGGYGGQEGERGGGLRSSQHPQGFTGSTVPQALRLLAANPTGDLKAKCTAPAATPTLGWSLGECTRKDKARRQTTEAQFNLKLSVRLHGDCRKVEAIPCGRERVPCGRERVLVQSSLRRVCYSREVLPSDGPMRKMPGGMTAWTYQA